VGVSVTVYYKGGPERADELSDTLARIRRRAAALPDGRKLDVAKERIGKVEERIKDDLDNLTASGCNRIRLATENAARALLEEYRGEKASDQIGGCFHSDERQIPFEGARQYGAVRAAFLAVAGVRRAGEGRGLAPRSAGGLRVGSGEWLTPSAESALWTRETMKWINREGRTDRGELEAQIGARVGNEPSRDAALFGHASNAIVGASCGKFDGEAVEPMKEE